ncbi:MAG: gfo/Idh/MocA family oxidoreductase [Nitrospiraceae bacterium]|nr:MAG: gfo/Idh/MocA family oxidoreductase [Nitrospiraceae bacterium]
MKVLVAGCGSIGQRHVGNLIDSDRIHEIILYTQNRDCVKELDDKGKICFTPSLDGVTADFAVVANETCKHIDTAIQLAEKGLHLFIEKPLSHNFDGIDALREAVEKKGIKTFVGYNLRFLKAMEYIKERLSGGILGNLYFVKIEVGQYLPFWRKNRDYRESYSSSAERGGGVALDLSHELDYMRYLFGDPLRWKVFRTRTGELDIDAEDMFEGLYLYEEKFICNVHMDYLQKDATRTLRIKGSKGELFCDFLMGELTVSAGNARTVIKDAFIFDINKTYRDEMDHFMDIVEKGTEPAVTLEDGIAVLKLIKDS